MDPETDPQLKEKLLQCRIMAALGGHDLGQWHPSGSQGYEARCRHCGRMIYATREAHYTVLGDVCTGQKGQKDE